MMWYLIKRTAKVQSAQPQLKTQNLEFEEPAEVLVSFNKDGVFPQILKYGQRRYKILKVNLVHAIKAGAVRIYFFSVSDEANAWNLGFNTESLRWWVEDHYSLAE